MVRTFSSSILSISSSTFLIPCTPYYGFIPYSAFIPFFIPTCFQPLLTAFLPSLFYPRLPPDAAYEEFVQLWRCYPFRQSYLSSVIRKVLPGLKTRLNRKVYINHLVILFFALIIFEHSSLRLCFPQFCMFSICMYGIWYRPSLTKKAIVLGSL